VPNVGIFGQNQNFIAKFYDFLILSFFDSPTELIAGANLDSRHSYYISI
jgi:hypothetical protein